MICVSFPPPHDFTSHSIHTFGSIWGFKLHPLLLSIHRDSQWIHKTQFSGQIDCEFWTHHQLKDEEGMGWGENEMNRNEKIPHIVIPFHPSHSIRFSHLFFWYSLAVKGDPIRRFDPSLIRNVSTQLNTSEHHPPVLMIFRVFISKYTTIPHAAFGEQLHQHEKEVKTCNNKELMMNGVEERKRRREGT